MKIAVISILVMTISSFLCFGERKSSKRLLEEVEVTNALISVRVYKKGKPVEGLEKKNFRLIENGKEIKINTCYMEKKILKLKSGIKNFDAETGISPRLFVLIFNISDDRLDIDSGVDLFFDKILRPNDRLIVRTNNFFLKDRRVLDPQAEKKKIKKFLRLEMKWARLTMSSMKNTLNLFISELVGFKGMKSVRSGGGGAGGEKDPDGMEEKAIRSFILNYRALIMEFKKTMIQIPLNEYIQLAAYLEKQNLEKWVLNYHQIPRFPQPNHDTDLGERIHNQRYYLDLISEINTPVSLPLNNIGKLFINTGATFHTILMKYQGESFYDMGGYLADVPLVNTAEGVLRKISRLTGGKVLRTNRIEDLFDKVSNKEDIYYVLAYKTRPLSWKKKRKVTVLVDNKNYDVVYDNQKRSRYFRKIENKIATRMKKQRPQIRINQVEDAKGILRILVSDYQLSSTTYPAIGKVQVRLQILDENSTVVMDKQKTNETVKKRLLFNIKLSELKKGQYDVVVMVHDLLTGKQDLTIQEVLI